jgi:hypothetical protein
VNRVLLLPRCTGLIAALVLLLASTSRTAGQTTPPADSAAALKAAALARAGRFSARGVSPERIEIIRVEGDFAAVRLYPKLGTTDPAIVILQRIDGAWTGIIGPGTGGLIVPDDPPGGPPLSLLGDASPYTGAQAAMAFAGVTDRLQIFMGAGFAFASIDGGFVQTSDSGFVQVWASADGPTTGAGFWFSIAPLNETPDGRFDDWAYDYIQTEITQMQTAPRTGDPSGPPRSETYFRTGLLNVFQVDWPFGDDRTARQLYVASKLGGPAYRLVTTLDRDGAATSPQAQTALSVALNTLQIGRPLPDIDPVRLLTYVDPYTGYYTQYPPGWSLSAADGYAARFSSEDGMTSIFVLPQTAASIDEAVQDRVNGPHMLISRSSEMLNGLPAEKLTEAVGGPNPQIVVWFAQLPSGQVLSIQSGGPQATGSAAQVVISGLRPLPATASGSAPGP